MEIADFAKIITANDLLSGEVVYLTRSGRWSPNHSDAILFGGKSTGDARLEEILELDLLVVGAYLADATRLGDNASSPIHFREVFRTKGPSNRLLGKQAA